MMPLSLAEEAVVELESDAPARFSPGCCDINSLNQWMRRMDALLWAHTTFVEAFSRSRLNRAGTVSWLGTLGESWIEESADGGSMDGWRLSALWELGPETA